MLPSTKLYMYAGFNNLGYYQQLIISRLVLCQLWYPIACEVLTAEKIARQSSNHIDRTMNFRVYVRNPTKEVDKNTQTTATMMVL
jgi:hypothetical protein